MEFSEDTYENIGFEPALLARAPLSLLEFQTLAVFAALDTFHMRDLCEKKKFALKKSVKCSTFLFLIRNHFGRMKIAYLSLLLSLPSILSRACRNRTVAAFP